MINYTKVDGNNYGDIKLFALSTCGWCKKTKKFLEDNNIAFSYVYVDKLTGDDLNECLEVQKKYNKEEAYPMVAIDEDSCILGYNKAKLEKIMRPKNG